MSYTHAWRINRKTLGMISPLVLASMVLVGDISADSPPRTVAAVLLFTLALCYVLARVTEDIKARIAEDIKAHHAETAETARRTGLAVADQARRHRETLTNRLHGVLIEEARQHGALIEEARQLVEAHDQHVELYRTAAAAFHDEYGPPSEGQRLHAVRDTERNAATPSA